MTSGSFSGRGRCWMGGMNMVERDGGGELVQQSSFVVEGEEEVLREWIEETIALVAPAAMDDGCPSLLPCLAQTLLDDWRWMLSVTQSYTLLPALKRNADSHHMKGNIFASLPYTEICYSCSQGDSRCCLALLEQFSPKPPLAGRRALALQKATVAAIACVTLQPLQLELIRLEQGLPEQSHLIQITRNERHFSSSSSHANQTTVSTSQPKGP